MTSFEFIIDGPPISQQARSRERLHAWRDMIRLRAEQDWPAGAPALEGVLLLQVTYYYEETPVDDSDIVTPILDALVGLVHHNHKQFTDISTSRQDLYGSFRVEGLTAKLAEGLSRGEEFIHIRVLQADQQEQVR